jgi:hypothetical protein
MTPNHDHDTLFVASPLAAEPVDRPLPAADDAETMRRLRDPFAIPAAEAPKPGKQSRTA